MSWAVVHVDYSHFYYRQVAGTDVPPLLRGKFVQVRREVTEYLIFAPAEYAKYHGQIVEHFCRDQGIEGSYDESGERYRIEDKAWNIAGGGKFELDRDRKMIRLYDNSMAYGKFDRRRLKDRIYQIPDFAGFTVLIE